MRLQKDVNSLFRLDIKEDGIIGPETRGAIANLNMTDEQKQAIYNQFPQLKTSTTKAVSTTKNARTTSPPTIPSETQDTAYNTLKNAKQNIVASNIASITTTNGETIKAPVIKKGMSKEDINKTMDEWQRYADYLETAGLIGSVGIAVGSGGTALPAAGVIATGSKIVGGLSGISNIGQGAYNIYQGDYGKGFSDIGEGVLQIGVPHVVSAGISKLFKPILKVLPASKALPAGKTVPITVPVKEVVKELPASKIVKELPAGKVKPTSGVKIVPSSGKTIIVSPKTPAPTTVLKTLPASSQPIPKLLPAGKAPVSAYKELFDFKTAEKTDWNDLGLFDYTRKGISATKKATNPKNLVPPKPRVQTPKKVVVKPATKPAPVNNNIPTGWEISPGKIDRNGNPVLRQIRTRQFGGYYFM